jgi:hypothetical protein
MAPCQHTKEQGLRLHHLANLGGLLAIAGLDQQPPDLLLGTFLEIAKRLPELSAARLAEITSAGHAKLDERASAKRAWRSWQRAKDLHAVTLTSSQIARVIAVLGGTPPQDTAQLPNAMAALLNRSA